MTSNETNRDDIIVKTSITGIIANVFLASFKAVIGIISHSIAITMDSVNNLSDAGSSLITIIGTKLSRKQPDKKHPWGYGRIEYLSAMLISVIVLYAGTVSFTESVKKVISPEIPEYSAASLVIVSVAVAVKIILGRYVKKTGERVNSDSLVNSGTDALMDAVISASTLAAAVIYIISGLSLEAWLGAIISVVIIKSGIDMLRDTLSDILGQRIDPETAKAVMDCMMEFPEVLGVYDLIFHDYGPDKINCSAHIEISDTMTADKIDRLENDIAVRVYSEYNIIITAIGIYAADLRDPETVRIRGEIYKIAAETEYILQIHGFYLDKDEKFMKFDVIVSFDADDRNRVYGEFLQRIKGCYPEYKIIANQDTDFSVSE
ncbi:MAG: cation transporter [Ruminococcus sp.]|nr:cation transporter [Ruminococcus sp.]